MLLAIFHLIELSDFAETPLGEDYKRMPALSVPLQSRQRFVASAMRDLAAAGNAVTLREFAASYRERITSDLSR
jgi:hypothetical protein